MRPTDPQIEYGPDYGMPGMDDSKLSLATLLEEGGAELTIIDSAENLSRYRGKFLAESRAKGVECTDDKLVGRAIREALGDAGALDRAPQVVWAQIGRVFETHVQQSEERVDMEAGTVAPLGQERHDKLCRRVARVDARLAKVWENAPAGTLVLVMTCAGNTPLVSRMARIRETTKGKVGRHSRWADSMSELLKPLPPCAASIGFRQKRRGTSESPSFVAGDGWPRALRLVHGFGSDAGRRERGGAAGDAVLSSEAVTRASVGRALIVLASAGLPCRPRSCS